MLMLTSLRALARQSKTAVIIYHVYDNWRVGRRFRAGFVTSSSGATHNGKTLQESVAYINRVFDDYVNYGNLSPGMLRGCHMLEIGPGDNLGVALKFLLAGATQVVCLDKFYSHRNLQQQRAIYQALRAQLSEEEQRTFDTIVHLELEGNVEHDSGGLAYLYGTRIEEADAILDPASFDIILSRAVIQELQDPDAAFAVMDRLLRPGGVMLHKIDLRDYGIFHTQGHHPLTFLTTPASLYRLMTSHSSKPNRKLLDYYLRKTTQTGYDTHYFITSLIGVPGELLPHKAAVAQGIDYSNASLALLKEIRPRLQSEYRNLTDQELMISGIFLIAKKPG
jgi:SAM-dependent methyltransferase